MPAAIELEKAESPFEASPIPGAPFGLEVKVDLSDPFGPAEKEALPAPYLGGSLHALEVDEEVSATRFASGFKAYERLPTDLRKRIDDLNALHVRARAFTRRTRLTDLLPSDNCAVHALVGRQKDTCRPYIFACLDMTACLIGMSEQESDAMLEALFSYLYADDQFTNMVGGQGTS